MAYADQQMSGNRITALIIVALIHIVLGYALITGLAYQGAQAVLKKLTTVDIKEEKKEEKPPPPPPKQKVEPPPIVVPPPPINIAPAPPPIQTVNSAPPPVFNPAPAFTPPPAPAPRFSPKSPTPKGRPGDWANTNDYPSGALRREEEGVTSIRVTVGTDGRVQSCEVTRSSGSSDLDNATCSLISRRGRFSPATDGDGQPTTGTWSSSIRWQIPKD